MDRATVILRQKVSGHCREITFQPPRTLQDPPPNEFVWILLDTLLDHSNPMKREIVLVAPIDAGIVGCSTSSKTLMV
jgi:hypothetical protein